MIDFVKTQLHCQTEGVFDLVRTLSNHYPAIKDGVLDSIREAYERLVFASLELDKQFPSVVNRTYEKQSKD